MSSAVAAPALAAAASSLRLQDATPPAKLVPGGLSSVRFFQQKCVGLVGHVRFVCRSGSDAGSLAAAAAAADKVLEVKGSDEEDDDTSVPTPIVNIDQHSDPFATVLEMRFGDRLGALLDTMKALTDLGLNVNRGYVSTSAPLGNNKFYITRADNGAKIEDPELLESIRLTIINNLLQYHPETSERLAMGEAFGKTAPPKKLDVDIATHINITKLSPERSLLKIETADRPGLLMEILRVLGDISVVVESADINTEGLVAKDQLYVSYHGEALSKSMEEVTKNCLQYYLRRPTTEEDSY